MGNGWMEIVWEMVLCCGVVRRDEGRVDIDLAT